MSYLNILSGAAGKLSNTALFALSFVGLGMCLCTAPASSETLPQTLQAVLSNHPTFKAAGAKLAASRENIVQARAGYLPDISAGADIGRRRIETRPSGISDGTSSPKGWQLNLSQPLFDGLRTSNAVDEAEAGVSSTIEQVRNEGQEVLQQTATAYLQAWRDQKIIRLRQKNLKIMSRHHSSMIDRLDAGTATTADVSQALVREQKARSALALAKAELATSRANYFKYANHAPTRLVFPARHTSLLPRSLKHALSLGEKKHPRILAAQHNLRSARHAIAIARSERLPNLSVDASYAKRFDDYRTQDSQGTGQVKLRLTVPIFQGGRVSSRVRQQAEKTIQLEQELRNIRREIKAQITSQWAYITSAKARIKADRAQIAAARLALDGVQSEERVGQRTILNVLDAEKELIDAEIDLVVSRTDHVIYCYNLLATTSRLLSTDMEAPALLHAQIEANEPSLR